MGRSPKRQNEVLKLIARYGVMDSNQLIQLLGTKLRGSWRREIFTNLCNEGLVVSGTALIGGRPSHYWMLPDEPEVREMVSARIGLSLDQFRTKRCHWSHFPHEALCTFFHAACERQMPTLKILRESTKNFVNLPEHLLSQRVRESGHMPDLCFGVPIKNPESGKLDRGFNWIAVEIDRARRSKKRVAERTNIYSRHTSFCGLLYLVADDKAAKNLRKIYSEKGAKDSLRIKGSSKAFLASAVAPRSLIDAKNLKVFCDGFEISLTSWLSVFSTKNAQTRDELLTGFSGITPENNSETRLVVTN